MNICRSSFIAFNFPAVLLFAEVMSWIFEDSPCDFSSILITPPVKTAEEFFCLIYCLLRLGESQVMQSTYCYLNIRTCLWHLEKLSYVKNEKGQKIRIYPFSDVFFRVQLIAVHLKREFKDMQSKNIFVNFEAFLLLTDDYENKNYAEVISQIGSSHRIQASSWLIYYFRKFPAVKFSLPERASQLISSLVIICWQWKGNV